MYLWVIKVTAPMKKTSILLAFLAFAYILQAQPLTGIKNIPGNYANLQIAIDSLNTKGVGSGGVTFRVTAGQVFNLTSNTFALKITATGTAANPIVFERTGSGANPLLVISGSSGSTDAGIWLSGTDYITFDGVDIRNSGISSANYLDYGFYLAGTATNGCSHVTLKNCMVRMGTSQTTAYGVYALSTATTVAGRNSYNTIENVTIKNSIRGIWFAGLAGFEDIGNKIQQVTIDSCGISGYTAYGINMVYQDSSEVTGSLLSHLTGNTMYVLQMNYSGNFKLMEDTLRNLINGSSGTLYAIYFPNSFGNNLVKGNVVHTASSIGGGINPIFRQIGSSTNHITENIIYNISSTYTAGQVFGIIARDGSATDHIYRNKVYNLTSAGNLGAIGTLFTSAATNVEYIYNNYVYDLKGPTTPSTYMIAGYYFIGGAVKFYYNTCYFSYTSISTTNTSAALYVNPANGTTLDARNNILVNTTNANTGTRAAAFWWAGTAYSNLASTCNNNLLYAGTPGAKNVIFTDGTNADQTLTAFKTRVSPRESVSVTEMPPFISVIAPFNLHINPGVPTQAESGGQTITSPPIATDYDNDIRWGNAGYVGQGTAPDIGADEFSILVTDCGMAAFVSPGDTICPGTATVSVVLKNFGPLPLSSVKINWQINALLMPQFNWTGNLAVNGTDTVILGSYLFHHDTTYTVLAWSVMPNYTADTASWNDTITKGNLFIKAPPELNLSASSWHICQGDTATITGTLTGIPPWSLVISDGTVQQTLSGITSAVFSYPVTPASTFTLTILSITDQGGCPNTTPLVIPVSVHPAPPASITPVGSTACCAGDSVTLMATIGLNFTYQWKKDGAIIPNATNYVFAAKQAGNYTVVVTSPVGCSGTSAPVQVFVHPSPVVNLGNDTTVGPKASLLLDAGPGFSFYDWSTGAHSQTITVDSSGTGLGTKTIWVKVTNNQGCAGHDTILITFVTNPGITNHNLQTFSVEQNIPNPATGTTTIRYTIPQGGDVIFGVVNLTGQVMHRETFTRPAGQHQTELDLSGLTARVYYYFMEFQGQRLTKKLVISH